MPAAGEEMTAPGSRELVGVLVGDEGDEGDEGVVPQRRRDMRDMIDVVPDDD